MTLMTQAEVEARMFHGGIARAEKLMQTAEDKGNAHRNPYAAALLRDYVLPLAEAIKTEVGAKKAGRRQAHVALLDTVDIEAASFLAVRYTMSVLLSSKPETHRSLAYGIGRTIHRELVLAQIHDEAPDLYHTLAQDLGRRLSKDERHRLTVFTMQAKQRGIPLVEWNLGSREQVGFYIMGLLEDAGLIALGSEIRTGHKREEREVAIHPDVVEQIDMVTAT